jgi:hypothetical protein
MVLLTILYIIPDIELKIFLLVFSNIRQLKSVPNYVVRLNVNLLTSRFV